MLTVKDAAGRARVSPSLVYALLRKRKLKAMRVGCRGRGKWLIEESDFSQKSAEASVRYVLPSGSSATYTFRNIDGNYLTLLTAAHHVDRQVIDDALKSI